MCIPEPTLRILPSGTVTYHYACPGTPKAAVILQHGFGDYSTRWARDYPFIVADLHNLSIDVYAMDMPGHGNSSGKRSIVHVGNAVHDHVALRQQLERSKHPLYLLGHSLGGLVVACSVNEHPQNLSGVVLVAPALPDPMAPLARWLVRLASSIIPSVPIPLRTSPVNTLSRNVDLVRRWSIDPNVFHGQISFLLASSALDSAAFLWRHLDAWSIPTLVIHGNKDTYTMHSQSQKFVEAISSADKQFYSVEGGLHDLFSDDPSNWQQMIYWLRSRVA